MGRGKQFLEHGAQLWRPIADTLNMAAALALYFMVATSLGPAVPTSMARPADDVVAAELDLCKRGVRRACIRLLERSEASPAPDLELIDYVHDLLGEIQL